MMCDIIVCSIIVCSQLLKCNFVEMQYSQAGTNQIKVSVLKSSRNCMDFRNGTSQLFVIERIPV